MRDPRLPNGRRSLQCNGASLLDLGAIYEAVRTVQKGIVKVIAARCSRRPVVFFRQQEREIGDHETMWRPFLWHQIVKQQVALETKPREEACAELICEADHLGADVVWRRQPGEAVDPRVALGQMTVELGDVARELQEAGADGHRTAAETAAIRGQLRELREAADAFDAALTASEPARPRSVEIKGATS